MIENFRIKICGVKKTADVDAVLASEADCIGLNFYQPSARSISYQTARQLADHAQGLSRVGLFVNEDLETVLQTQKEVGFDVVQLHGNESPMFIKAIRDGGVPVIRAVRLPRETLTVDQIKEQTMPWLELGCRVLLDAESPSHWGGSGECLDWNCIGDWAKTVNAGDWILAGGLTIENVAQAVAASGATAVDVASGTESTKGVKDPHLIREFASIAFAEMG